MFALQYSRTFVSYRKYDGHNALTCLWVYEKVSRIVIYFHQEGYCRPPSGSICIVYNDRNHFEYLTLDSNDSVREEADCEIRILCVGDIIEYCTDENKEKIEKTRVKTVCSTR